MRQHRKNPKSLALLLVLLLQASNCASLGLTSQQSDKTLAYKTLLVGKQTYDSVYTMLAQMDKKGMLTAENKATAIRLGNLYESGHNQAVDDLLAGKEPALGAVRAALDGFINYGSAIKGGK